MKRIVLLATICLLAGSSICHAQLSREQMKERKELKKASKKELQEKATKEARKEAKNLTKQGWQAVPGALPVEKQLDKSYLMQMEYDADGYPKYIMGEAMSIGENYDAAKVQALELAKLKLAGEIQTEVTALAKNSVDNKQLSAEEAASVTETIMANQNLISQSIGRTVIVMELFRTLPNKNKEVLVRIAYNGDMAKEAAKKTIREKLENKSEELHEKLDKVMGW